MNQESKDRVRTKKNLTARLSKIESSLAELPTEDPRPTAYTVWTSEVVELKNQIKALDTKTKNCSYVSTVTFGINERMEEGRKMERKE